MAMVMREDMPKHLKACLHRTVPCAQCNTSIKYQDEQNHRQYTCPGVGVACQHNGGCGKTVQREAMRAHIDTECSRAMMTCAVPGCQKQANLKIAEQGAELAKLKKSMMFHPYNDTGGLGYLCLWLVCVTRRLADSEAAR
eukprot:jgi/Mesvir1/22923/Mv19439-RA.1